MIYSTCLDVESKLERGHVAHLAEATTHPRRLFFWLISVAHVANLAAVKRER